MSQISCTAVLKENETDIYLALGGGGALLGGAGAEDGALLGAGGAAGVEGPFGILGALPFPSVSARTQRLQQHTYPA